MSEKLYLRETTQVEPLFNNWYAWPFLIAPATAAMLTSFHLRLLESFVMAPQIHQAAAKNPAVRGGPFMDYTGDLAPVTQFIGFIKEDLAYMLKFANAVKLFDRKLRAEIKGSSLASYYAQIPAELRGYVELGYDLNHNPSMRFLESLLYRSPYYRPDLQSVVFSEEARDDRAFVLSTPRVDPSMGARVRLPFASDRMATLMASRDQPVSREFIEQIINENLDPSADKERFWKMFSSAEPIRIPERNCQQGEVRVRYFGHATLLIESHGVSILTDPIISYGNQTGLARYSFQDLPDRIDFVLLTHAHQDHVMFETMLQIRHKVGTWVVPKNSMGSLQDPSLKMILNALGICNVMELDEMQVLEVDDGQITGIPFFGEHGDLHIRSKLAYHVRLAGSKLLLLADSRNVDPVLYDHIHKIVGDVDAMFIGMECEGAPMSWVYGPLFSSPVDRTNDHSRRLNGSDSEQAWQIVCRFSPRSVFVYAMGQEPWLQFISSIAYTKDSMPIVESDKLLSACSSKGIHSERLFGKKMINMNAV